MASIVDVVSFMILQRRGIIAFSFISVQNVKRMLK